MEFDINKVVLLDLRTRSGKKFTLTRLIFIAQSLSINPCQVVDWSNQYKKVWYYNDGQELTQLIWAIGDLSWEPAYSFELCQFITNEQADAIRLIKAIEVPKSPRQGKIRNSPKPSVSIVIGVEGQSSSVDTTPLHLDDVLDKINESGMESLTSRELEFLKEISQS